MKSVNASIITIGDELLIGQTIDTNSAWMAEELNKIGVWVRRKVTVGDVWEDIWNALDEESRESDIILITGGLGPTADDITKPLLCKYFNARLVENEQVLKHIIYLFEHVYHRPMPLLERNRKQAEVPDVCTVLMNERGTAPGMWFERPPQTPPKEGLPNAHGQLIEDSSGKTKSPTSGLRAKVVPKNRDRDGAVFIALPGVPNEMKGLMAKEVLPRLQKHFSLPVIIHQSLLTAGVGESVLAEHIREWEEKLPTHMKLAYLPQFGMVKLRITGTGDDRNKLEKEIEDQFAVLKNLVKKWLVIDEDMTMPQAVAKLLKERKETVGTAESCTGGYLAHLLSRDPGSSSNYKGSIVSYDNKVKEDVLDVSHKTIESFGAVSEQTIMQMAKGGLEQLKSDYIIATSGIMGPDGGSEKKPIGTVWIAVGNKKKIIAEQFLFRFDRSRNIEQTALTALNMLRKFIKNKENQE